MWETVDYVLTQAVLLAANIIMLLLFVRTILTFVAFDSDHPLVNLVFNITDAILTPARIVLDKTGWFEDTPFDFSQILTEEDQTAGAGDLKNLQKTHAFAFACYGGAEGAERRIAVLYDRNYEDAAPSDFADIALMKLTATDRTVPAHRAVLGSILGLGVERKMIGDIFPFEDGVAIAIKEQILPYIQKELDKVGHSRVLPSPFRTALKSHGRRKSCPSAWLPRGWTVWSPPSAKYRERMQQKPFRAAAYRSITKK